MNAYKNQCNFTAVLYMRARTDCEESGLHGTNHTKILNTSSEGKLKIRTKKVCTASEIPKSPSKSVLLRKYKYYFVIKTTYWLGEKINEMKFPSFSEKCK